MRNLLLTQVPFLAYNYINPIRPDFETLLPNNNTKLSKNPLNVFTLSDLSNLFSYIALCATA